MSKKKRKKDKTVNFTKYLRGSKKVVGQRERKMRQATRK